MLTDASQPAGLTEQPFRRWFALGVLAISVLLGMSSWFSTAAVLSQLRSEWQLSSGLSAWLTISVQLGFVAGSLISAFLNLADLIPPRRLILFGAAGASLANAALVLSSGPETAIPLRFISGASLALVYPPGLKAIATWFRRGRGTALGVMIGAVTLGSALPHLLNWLGGVNWQSVLLASSGLTLAGGLLAETLGKEGPYPFPRAVFDPRQAAQAFSNRGTRLAALGYFGHMWELYAMWSWFAVFFSDVLSRQGRANPQRDAALATFLVIGSGFVGCVGAGLLGDGWGRTRTAALAMAISGSCALIIGLNGLPVELVLAIGIVWGISIVADSAQFSTIVTEVADQRYVGTAVTLQLAAGFTLTVLTIWLVPVIRDQFGWYWAFAMLALGPALGIIAMLRLLYSPAAATLGGGRG